MGPLRNPREIEDRRPLTAPPHREPAARQPPPTRTITGLDTKPYHPELLAPAGDFDAMRAAVANGADAVYFGLQEFNARHRATNFTLADLPRVMEFLHSRSVRGFVTFNILIFSDELPEALRHLRAIHAAGVDAVIVQDLGLVRLLRRALPGLEIHGSTQMTLTEPRGIDFVHSLGVERVVLARELSLDDIRKIRAATPTPVEVFIHGALCVSYSGQCLTSEALGGRSANRGQCAQACRLPYDLVVDQKVRDLGDLAYLLSPQDLAAYEVIDELVSLGVSSFKIEGRLKSPDYVAATSQTYRAAIDAALAHKDFHITPQQELDLAQSFSRGFSHGFLSGVNHQALVNGTYSKKRGVRLGSLVDRTDRSLIISLEHPTVTLKPGDGVAFDTGGDQNTETGGRIVSVRNLKLRPDPQTRLRLRGLEITLHNTPPSAIPLRATVWKTDDPAIRKRLERSYSRDLVVHRVPIDAAVETPAGQSMTVTLTDPLGHAAEVHSDEPLELANNHPVSVELLREQLGRLGDTPFELRDVKLTGDAVMAPKSLLNDLRRRAVEKLTALRAIRPADTGDANALETMRAEIKGRNSNDETRMTNQAPNSKSQAGGSFSLGASNLEFHSSFEFRHSSLPHLHLLCRTMDQLDAALAWRDPHGSPLPDVYCDFEDVRRYKLAVAKAREAGVPVALATLRIIKPSEHGLLNQIADCNPDALLVRHLSAVTFYKDVAPHIPMIGDYALNIANELTAALFAEQGLKRLTPSYDLNFKQLAAMLSHIDPSLFEVTVHQHMPMFHMEHCVFAHTLSDGADFRTCGRPCDTHTVSLRDRAGVDHPLAADVGCRNTLFNGTAQSAAEFIPRMLALGLRHFRLELLRDSAEQSRALLDRYSRLLLGLDTPADAFRSLRVLHQLGVTRGTLESE
jgi:putative protease